MSSAKPILSHQETGKGFYLAQFKTGCLSIFSYYIESNKQAILIDPTLDVQVFKEHAEKRGAQIIEVILTHYHADFLAGHLQFEVPILMGQYASRAVNTFKVIQSKDGYKHNLGSVYLKTLHTPGHTTQSACWRLFDENGKQFAIFTGDTIFIGEVGRPDLAVSAHTSKQDLAKALFNSIRKVIHECDPQARIYPGHGAGSSCGKKIGDGNYCTLKTQMEKNYALKIKDQNEFVKVITAGMPNPPAYFFHDAGINQKGMKKFDEMFKEASISLTPQQFKQQIEKGAIALDVRHEPKDGHIKGIYVATEKGTVGGWVGSIWKPQQRFLIFADQQRAKNQTIERLLRIGFFNIAGYNNFSMADWKAKGFDTWQIKLISAKQFSELKDVSPLDVRKPIEWAQTGVIQGATLISLDQVDNKWQQMKQKQNIWVHCRSGWRAQLACSILRNHGISSNVIYDKVGQFKNNGINMVPWKQQ